jgi:hypothetical protein
MIRAMLATKRIMAATCRLRAAWGSDAKEGSNTERY